MSKLSSPAGGSPSFLRVSSPANTPSPRQLEHPLAPPPSSADQHAPVERPFDAYAPAKQASAGSHSPQRTTEQDLKTSGPFASSYTPVRHQANGKVKVRLLFTFILCSLKESSHTGQGDCAHRPRLLGRRDPSILERLSCRIGAEDIARPPSQRDERAQCPPRFRQ